MGRWPIGVSAAAALLALPLALPLTGCSPDSSGAGDTLPPLVASTTASPITGVTTSTVPVTAAPTPPPTTVMVYDAVGISQTFGAATVRVLVDHCGVTAGASGFAIDDRHVVTSRDAVADDPTPEVVTRDGRTVTTTLIGFDPAVDVAVLRAEPGTFTTTVTWGDSAAVVEGASLTVIGYPDPGDYDVLDVAVRSVADDGSAFRLDVPIDAGQGGSPAFTATGGVVGVASPAGGDDESALVVPAALAAAVAGRIVAAPQAPQTACTGGTPGTTAAPTPVTASTVPASTVPPTTQPGDTTTSSTVPGSTTSTSLPGPGTGQEAKGTWIMQLASARSSTATPAAIAEQTAAFEELVSGVHTLRSNDWPKAYPTPDLVVFYVGGFASKAAVEAKCVALGLTVPDDCLARFLDG